MGKIKFCFSIIDNPKLVTFYKYFAFVESFNGTFLIGVGPLVFPIGLSMLKFGFLGVG